MHAYRDRDSGEKREEEVVVVGVTDGLGRGNDVPRSRWGDPECWDAAAGELSGGE